MNFLKKSICGVLALSTLTTCTSLKTSASSSSKTDRVPALSATITSDVWRQTWLDSDGSGEFQVTSKYNSTDPQFESPEWIKASWGFWSVGLGAGVSFAGVASVSAGGHGATTSSSGTWINDNGAKLACYRGRFASTGMCLYVGVSNTASGFKSGVAFSTTAKVEMC